MCDYSISNSKSRPAVVGDKLVTKDFGFGTKGFADVSEIDTFSSEATAVCVLPGTEVAFDEPVKIYRWSQEKFTYESPVLEEKTARFRQIDKDNPNTHHDALEFGDGNFVLLTHIIPRQNCTILQMPAVYEPRIENKERATVPYALSEALIG